MRVELKRCVFFDRDGIVNEAPSNGYVLSWDEFRIKEEFIDVLRTVNTKGYEAIIISNQRCVALGLVSSFEIDDIHNRLKNIISNEYGLKLLDIYYCPHDDGVCNCRKPQPGMLLRAAREHHIYLPGSWTVGDQERDVLAGKNAGTRTVLVSEYYFKSVADYVVKDLESLKELFEVVL